MDLDDDTLTLEASDQPAEVSEGAPDLALERVGALARLSEAAPLRLRLLCPARAGRAAPRWSAAGSGDGFSDARIDG